MGNPNRPPASRSPPDPQPADSCARRAPRRVARETAALLLLPSEIKVRYAPTVSDHLGHPAAAAHHGRLHVRNLQDASPTSDGVLPALLTGTLVPWTYFNTTVCDEQQPDGQHQPGHQGLLSRLVRLRCSPPCSTSRSPSSPSRPKAPAPRPGAVVLVPVAGDDDGMGFCHSHSNIQVSRRRVRGALLAAALDVRVPVVVYAFSLVPTGTGWPIRWTPDRTRSRGSTRRCWCPGGPTGLEFALSLGRRRASIFVGARRSSARTERVFADVTEGGECRTR